MSSSPSGCGSGPSYSSPNDNPTYVFFYEWEVTPTHPLSIVCFSQWYPSSFTDPSDQSAGRGHNVYKTNEHYMMYHKALLFDPAAAPAILAAPTPDEAKALGREVRNFDRGVWDKHADGIVERSNYLKFEQNGGIWRYLRETRGKVMVEASPTDRIWGIGFAADEALAHEKEWGTNRMGLALTRARDQLLTERQGE